MNCKKHLENTRRFTAPPAQRARTLADVCGYDYDYEKPNVRTLAALDAANSDSELSEKLSHMGFAVKQKLDKLQNAERLQADVRLNAPNNQRNDPV